MKNLLLITDQQEYSEHGTVTAFFDGFLRKHFNIQIVFLTKYKDSFQIKGDHFIVPIEYENKIIEYLSDKNIKIDTYDMIIVRNKKDILKNVLDNKVQYDYKVGYRTSYPKRFHQLELLDTSSLSGWFRSVLQKSNIRQRDTLANRCDLFLPTSFEVRNVFYENIHTECFPLFPGLDPDNLNEHKNNESDVKKFIYVGRLDKLREFNIVLDAFSKLRDENWELTLSLKDKEYIVNLLKKYPNIVNKITLTSAHSLQELRDQVNEHDVGLDLLPNVALFNTSISDKVMDYYTCSVPTLMSSNGKNRSIFDETEALFSDFDKKSITYEIQKILKMSNDELSKIGNAGQKKLLGRKRNYQLMAEQLKEKLDEILN
jgi:glycosyltransferase involved in cell wall biosynthesis